MAEEAALVAATTADPVLTTGVGLMDGLTGSGPFHSMSKTYCEGFAPRQPDGCRGVLFLGVNGKAVRARRDRAALGVGQTRQQGNAWAGVTEMGIWRASD